MAKPDGIRKDWSRIYGTQIANTEMFNKYRKGWERVFGKREIGCEKCGKITCICHKSK